MARERKRTPRQGNPNRDNQTRPAAYTPAKPFFRNRLLVQLLSIAAVVLAFTVGIYIFFKVDTILVTGAEKHSAYSVAQASGIREGDSLLFFGRSKAAGKIKLELPYVDTVRFQVKLPGTVNIIVEEKPVAYALQAQDGSWWLVTSEGKVAESVEGEPEENCPRVSGVLLSSPAVGQPAVAAEISTEAGTATASDRLEAALVVLYQLERYELFDRVTELDVRDLFDLQMYCGDRYTIKLGDAGTMSEKISLVKNTLAQLGTGGSGVLELQYRDETWKILCYPISQP